MQNPTLNFNPIHPWAARSNPESKNLPFTVFTTLVEWNRRFITRQHLAELTAVQLDDMGISEADRTIELNKPFWRA